MLVIGTYGKATAKTLRMARDTKGERPGPWGDPQIALMDTDSKEKGE
jgi:hypothetical protein